VREIRDCHEHEFLGLADNARPSKAGFCVSGLLFLPKSYGYARRKSLRASGHAAEILLIRRETCGFSPELPARPRFLCHGAGAF
jgi:hypothetical protein